MIARNDLSRFELDWSAQMANVKSSREGQDHLATRQAFDLLVDLAFEAEGAEPMNELIALGWTPWMREPQRFFPLFHAKPERAEQLFERFPDYAGWFPLTDFLISRADGARKNPQERLASLNRLSELACFAKQPFKPSPADAPKLFAPLSRGAERHPAAEAFLGLSAWARASRAEALAFGSALIKGASVQAAPFLAEATAQTILRCQRPGAPVQRREARELLTHLVAAGAISSISALCEAEPAFLSELRNSGSFTPMKRQNEMAHACLPHLKNYFVGLALLGPAPSIVSDLIKLGAPKPKMTYWREEALSSIEASLAEIQAGGKDAAKASRRVARAKIMAPLAIEIDEEEREALLRALEGERNAMSAKALTLKIGSEASLAEIALVALLSDGSHSAIPSANWPALGPALSAALEPDERLGETVAKAKACLLASGQPPTRLREDLRAYLEGLEIRDASQSARPEAAPAPTGRLKL